MPLPPALRLAIDTEAAAVDRAALRRAAVDVSQQYRTGSPGGALTSAAGRAAYLLTRLPATYAANCAVLRELDRIENQGAKIKDVLDLGSGPATALWAIAERFPAAERFTAVEVNPELISIGRRLASQAAHVALREACWMPSDLRRRPALPRHDLVILSYALGELPDAVATIDWAWQLAKVALVIVEPGTPNAFRTVLSARDRLIGLGATVAAPCPHHEQCPLAANNDWCHFRARLERTAEHRRLKEAELGYEDEKFSYVVAAKGPANAAPSRIVRHPLRHPGHIRLTLCTPGGLQKAAIGKSKKELYRLARNVDWGDAWPWP